MFSFKYILFLIFSAVTVFAFSQEISLYEQFNGNYDYTAFGNTLNTGENGQGSPCSILTSSSANFQLETNQEIVAAYLYWAGSGPGDFNITFNGVPIQAERTFSTMYSSGATDYLYFGAFANITTQLLTTGSGTYTLSDLDLTNVIPPYCSPPGSGTNFGGWAVMVIYENPDLPINQVNVFDGFENVSINDQNLNISLDNLLIVDTEGAKIGFLAWEGDRGIAVNETLRINGHILSNPPLNPANNAFNGTNSFTGSNNLYNMDIDFYSISDYINPGDTSATIQLTSGQDFVIINNIITVLNSELPDATVTIDSTNGFEDCGNRDINVEYTIYNLNSTATLPAATPIAVYVDDILVAQSETQNDIPINGQENGSISFTVPDEINSDFILKITVDDVGDGTGIITESDENNNEDQLAVHLFVYPVIDSIVDLETCELIDVEYFDLTEAVDVDSEFDLSFHLSATDAENNLNAIMNPERFQNSENPQTIYIRVSNFDCYLVDDFTITVIPCPLPDATIDFPEISACRDRMLKLPFTVYNLEATGALPANVSVTFYSENIFLGSSNTQNSIPVGGSETGVAELFLTDELDDSFIITAIVDIENLVEEYDEQNNSFSRLVSFKSIAPIPELPKLVECSSGFDKAIFDLTVQDELIRTDTDDIVRYFTNLEDMMLNINPINNPAEYLNDTNPQQIFVRLDNDICFATGSFWVETERCQPFIPQGFSPNGDGINDLFEITNLLDIYKDFELQIYTRNGNLIHTSHNVDGFWNGVASQGLLFTGSIVPTGVYYYVLVLNDPKYPEPFIGWLYVNY
jgi:gliding motility-associated-like protein